MNACIFNCIIVNCLFLSDVEATWDRSGDLMFDPVWEAIVRLERMGFHVSAKIVMALHQVANCDSTIMK